MNPISHVGKLLSIAAQRVAVECARLEGAGAAECVLVSQIGRPITGQLHHVDGLGLAGEARAAVHAHGARAADGAAARVAQRERAVLVVSDLQEGVEHRRALMHLDFVVVVAGVFGTGVLASDPEVEIH